MLPHRKTHTVSLLLLLINDRTQKRIQALNARDTQSKNTQRCCRKTSTNDSKLTQLLLKTSCTRSKTKAGAVANRYYCRKLGSGLRMIEFGDLLHSPRGKCSNFQLCSFSDHTTKAYLIDHTPVSSCATFSALSVPHISCS